MKQVLILTGSTSDYPLLADLEEILNENNITYTKKAASCHRDLDGLYGLLQSVKESEYRAIIAVANSVSNMPAIVASYLKDTKIIVVGVGLNNKGMNGIDSLLSINTIPRGVPLVNTGVGKTGLYNAALFMKKIFKK